MADNDIAINDVFDFDLIDFSLRPSPLDLHDWKAEAIYPGEQPVPQTLDLRRYIPPIRNQGNQGACTTFAACSMKECQEYKEKGLTDYMSCQFLYNLRPNHPTSGMHLRDAMKVLQTLGVCTEDKFPYLKNTSNVVSTDALKQAKNFKIMNYAQVDTLEALKKALYKNGPCIIAFPVWGSYNDFWKKKSYGASRGGHCVSVVGYNFTGFIIRNSWSERWGDKGYCHYPFTDWGSHWEVWTSIDGESDILTGLDYDYDRNPDNNDPEPDPNNKKKNKNLCGCTIS